MGFQKCGSCSLTWSTVTTSVSAARLKFGHWDASYHHLILEKEAGQAQFVKDGCILDAVGRFSFFFATALAMYHSMLKCQGFPILEYTSYQGNGDYSSWLVPTTITYHKTLRRPLFSFCISLLCITILLLAAHSCKNVCEAQPPRPVCLMSWCATQAFRSPPRDTTTYWLSRKCLAQGRLALASGQSSQIRQIQQRPTEATYSNFSLLFLESMSGCVVVERGVPIWQIPNFINHFKSVQVQPCTLAI